jgi:hypothetical protein
LAVEWSGLLAPPRFAASLLFFLCRRGPDASASDQSAACFARTVWCIFDNTASGAATADGLMQALIANPQLSTLTPGSRQLPLNLSQRRASPASLPR